MATDRSAALFTELKQTAARMRELVDEPAGDNGGLSVDQDTEFDRLHERQEEISAELASIKEEDERRSARLEIVQKLEDDLKRGRGTKAGQQDTRDLDLATIEEEEEREDPDEAYSRAFESYLRYGAGFMAPEERQIVMRNWGGGTDRAFTPEARFQSVAQDTKGGFLVPEGMMQSVTKALKQFGGLRRSRAQVITTSDGREIPWPTYDDTSNTGRLLAEGKARSTTDVTFGASILHAYGYSSDFIKVSFELLQDSAVDIVGMIGDIAGERIGRITSTHFTTGDGASKPYGIATQATSGATAAGSNSVVVDDLLNLKHSVDPAYREMAEWMFNDTTLKEIKQLKDGEGRPIWQSGIATGEPNTIDGDPYVVNQDVANTATTNKAVLYGDFSLYKIRDVAGMQLRRLDERFADNGQVAFILFSRHDGVLVNAGQGPVKALTMA